MRGGETLHWGTRQATRAQPSRLRGLEGGYLSAGSGCCGYGGLVRSGNGTLRLKKKSRKFHLTRGVREMEARHPQLKKQGHFAVLTLGVGKRQAGVHRGGQPLCSERRSQVVRPSGPVQSGGPVLPAEQLGPRPCACGATVPKAVRSPRAAVGGRSTRYLPSSKALRTFLSHKGWGRISDNTISLPGTPVNRERYLLSSAVTGGFTVPGPLPSAKRGTISVEADFNYPESNRSRSVGEFDGILQGPGW